MAAFVAPTRSPSRASASTSSASSSPRCSPSARPRPSRVPRESDRRRRGQALLRALPALRRRAVRAGRVRRRRVALFKTSARARLATAIVFAVAVAGLLGVAADHLTPTGDRYARVAPAAGFWALAFAGSILFADSVVRLKLGPLARARGARARRGGLRAGAVVRRLERSVDPQGIRDPRRRVLARSRRASRSRGRFARRGDSGRPAARRPDRAQDGDGARPCSIRSTRSRRSRRSRCSAS
jgi:hypothetical protein